MNYYFILILTGLVASSLVLGGVVFAETKKISMEGAMDLEITYPESVFQDRKFQVSVFMKNNGWEEKQDIILSLKEKSDNLVATGIEKITLDSLTPGSTHGNTLEFHVSNNASPGKYFLNFEYSQVLLKNNNEPQAPNNADITLPITVRHSPSVQIDVVSPEVMFSKAEFPFEVSIFSNDIDIHDVTISIKTPQDIEFRGETKHTFSTITKDTPVSFTARLITPDKEVTTEHIVPFEIIVEYTNDIGMKEKTSKTVDSILRPRTFMEITTDGGIWVGDIFLAPYISIGTIVGIPAGTLFSIFLKRMIDKKQKKKRSK